MLPGQSAGVLLHYSRLYLALQILKAAYLQSAPLLRDNAVHENFEE